MRRFATVLALGCLIYVLLPTAPPWMAGGGSRSIPLDALPPLQRTAGRGWRHIGLEGFVQIWDTGRDWANPTAAMPSLHAAIALFIVVFFWPMVRRRWLRGLMVLHPILMGMALVYLAEHYVIDVLAGWFIVAMSFWAWAWIERRSAARHGELVVRLMGAGDRGTLDQILRDLHSSCSAWPEPERWGRSASAHPCRPPFLHQSVDALELRGGRRRPSGGSADEGGRRGVHMGFARG